MTDISDSHLIDIEPPADKTRVLKDVAAGTVGGIAQTLAGNPFDTVKVRLQSAPKGTYDGPTDVIKKLIQREGPTGFYKGVLTPLVGVGACVSIQFAVNEYMKRQFTEQNNNDQNLKDKSLSLQQFYVCGAAAGFVNGFLTSPIEHIRIRLQTQISTTANDSAATVYRGPVDCTRKLYGQAGIAGIFRGLGPTLLREGHGLGVYFATYEFLVKHDMKSNELQRTELPGYRLCSYGAVSGIALWLTAYPIDVIKTRLQTDDLRKKVFSSSMQCAKYIMKTGGWKAFFGGFSVCLLRAAPANAVTFYAFEATMRALG